ncbi:hypothetical protein Btru_011123 [Bulinus truncatus]|nr:hypothetical protein Btru_011123 [Bulinus truncatus]
MRVAGQHRYHIACFLCKICKRQLGNNEKYHLVNGTDIYCTNHYRDMVNGENSDGQQPPKKAKRNRTSYTETQIKFLQDRFLRDSNPDGGELEKIAKHIGLKKRVVQVWFQNNRARLKKSANNNKGGNQENKNPTSSNGITGPGSMHDFQTMDWDNSMDPKSMDEQSYSNSPTAHPHTRPSSAHFLDSAYSTTPGLNAAISAPLLCMPPGHTTASGLGNGPSSLGEGSGSGGSNCETPRDQGSPQFSDLSTPAMTTAGDSSTDDVAASVSHDFPPMTCTNGPGLHHPPLMSALRSSVMGDKFPDGLGLRGDAQEPPQSAGRLFHDDVHHRQLHHPDPTYGSAHLGLYGSFYNMCNTPYPSRDSMVGDTATDGFLRHRESHTSSYAGSSQNSIFGHDASPAVNPPSPPLCNIGFPGGPGSGQQGCSPPVSCHFTSGQGRNQSSSQLFNYLTGYGRSSCSSPTHPGRQAIEQKKESKANRALVYIYHNTDAICFIDNISYK